VSQLLTGHSRAVRGFVAAGLLVAAFGCRATPTSINSGATGRELLAAVRTEPRNFTRLTAREETTDLVALLIHATLVRINRVTDEVEPMLADSWKTSGDGRTYTVALRSGVQFSDGEPFTADDVVFSLAAIYASESADALLVGGQKIAARAVDPLHVEFTFPEPFAPGLRRLDDLVILPKHKLDGAMKTGNAKSAWGLSTPPSELAGLGPFVLSSYQPGQRLTFTRNPRYWRKDAKGVQLPYLDRVTLDVVPDQSTQLLRMEAGEADLMMGDISPDAYATLKQDEAAGKVRVYDLGGAFYPDSLWFNLKPGALAGDPRASWLQRDELRQAIELAVDRKAFIDTVFLGAAVPVFGAVSPNNKHWYWTGTPEIPHDVERAKKLLASIGITPEHRGRFTLVTQKGRPSRERGAAVIRDQLKPAGLDVDVVAIEGNALIQQVWSGKYDATYFGFGLTDTDPAMSADFWPSTGSEHVWNREQKKPSTEWEARIDDLFRRLLLPAPAADRKQLFDEIQKIFVEHQPMIAFAAPRVFVTSSARLGNVVAAPGLQVSPRLLWSPDTLTVTGR
jgi:peptide/nickel transport system substrate-binding protein